MNERIKRLFDQSLKIEYGIDNGFDRVTVDQDKFAKLIIQACISKVSEWDMGIDDPVGATDNTSEVARNIVIEIKQHFGVGE